MPSTLRSTNAQTCVASPSGPQGPKGQVLVRHCHVTLLKHPCAAQACSHRAPAPRTHTAVCVYSQLCMLHTSQCAVVPLQTLLLYSHQGWVQLVKPSACQNTQQSDRQQAGKDDPRQPPRPCVLLINSTHHSFVCGKHIHTQNARALPAGDTRRQAGSCNSYRPGSGQLLHNVAAELLLLCSCCCCSCCCCTLGSSGSCCCCVACC